MKRTHTQKGFTLIEIIIVISILGIVANITGLMIYQAAQSASFQYKFNDMQNQARLALERIIRDLHTIRSNTDIVTPLSENEITFKDPDSASENDEIIYSLNGNVLERNGQPLADHIHIDTTYDGFNVYYFDENGDNGITNNTDIQYIGVKITLKEGNKIVEAQTTIYPNWFEEEEIIP